MSSITSRRRDLGNERGQVLVLFAGGIVALLIIAALAFDVGMMLLERRDEQNAADAAALAGARYVFDEDCVAPAWDCPRAREAALAVALENGYDDSDPNESVEVKIPAEQGRYVGLPNFVEVDITSVRASIFGGVMGRVDWPVSAFAVATNKQDLSFPFSMLALNRTACKAIHVSGQGVVEAWGNVQSNSNGSDPGCAGIGLSRTGGGELTIHADDATCRSAGIIQDQGSGEMTCTQAPNSFALPDPLRFLDPPAKPPLAADMQFVKVLSTDPALPVSDYCPGSTAKAPTETSSQRTCDPGNRVRPYTTTDYRGKAWILSPGLYPNGIHATNGVVLYLLPGVYWIEGGGFQVDSDSTVISINHVADANANPDAATWSGVELIGYPGYPPHEAGPRPGPAPPYAGSRPLLCEMYRPRLLEDPLPTETVPCGVLIYNSRSTTVPFAPGPISLGGLGGRLLLSYLALPPSSPYDAYNTMVVYQDRNVTETVTLNGSSAYTEVSGIVYVPSGHVQVNGSSSDFTLDQIIADTFTVNGNVGTISILKRVGLDALITAAGLVD